VVLKLRHGEEAYVNHAEPFLEGDYSTLESNELWNADHHPFDVLVKVSERLDGSSGEMVASRAPLADRVPGRAQPKDRRLEGVRARPQQRRDLSPSSARR
jgi:hypothetical protein